MNSVFSKIRTRSVVELEQYNVTGQTMTDITAEVLSKFELPPSKRHRLLAAERRRLALDILAGTTSVVELEDLAAEIAEREGGTPIDEDTINRVATSLHHVHLPQMAEVDMLNYDPELHLVEPSEPLQFQR